MLYDKLESHLRSLESLDIKSETYDALLFPMVESCLSVPILRAWQRSAESRADNRKKDPQESRLSKLMNFLSSEVENEARISLACEGFGMQSEQKSTATKKPKTAAVKSSDEKNQPTAMGLANEEKKNNCAFCDKYHLSVKCFKAEKMTVDEKRELLKKTGRCYNCFEKGHRANKCTIVVQCGKCAQNHQPLLCNKPTETKENVSKKPEDDATTASCSNINSSQVILQTAVITLRNGTREKAVRVLFDTGSQRSHILKSTATELGLTPNGQKTITHVLFGGVETKNVPHFRYRIQMKNRKNQFTFETEVLDQDRICGNIPSVTFGHWMQELKDKKIWLDDLNNEGQIEVLIGADIYGRLQTGKVIQMECGLTAVETQLGWTVMGPHMKKAGISSSMLVTSLVVSNYSLSELWSLETIGIRDPIELQTKEEKEQSVRKHFQQTIAQDEDGRYQVALPWSNREPPDLPNNRSIAEKRLHRATQKLKLIGRFSDYQKVFDEWESEGFITKINAQPEKCHILCHRPVFKDESQTTKVRPVFDGSCKVGRAPSLNQCLEKGPNMIDRIPAVTHRFRVNRIGVISDIRKAFPMIAVKDSDCNYLLFLWWETPECKKMVMYRHNRVVFGLNCSPFLLAAVIEYHLSKYNDDDRKQLAQKLLHSLYVDNFVTSVKSENELNTFICTSTEIMKDAAMDLRLWQDSFNTTPDMDERVVTVLGMKWDRFDDCLYCDIRATVPVVEKVTKRTILSLVQQVFDFLGVLCPVTLVPKLMLQKAWLNNKNWDEELDAETTLQFENWMSELPKLSHIKIPRWFGVVNEDFEQCSIHTFCDASKDAYAAVTFIRSVTGKKIVVQLVQATSRVAPLGKSGIPRLELMGCTVGSRLASSVKAALNLSEVKMYFWSDSTTALAWLKRNDEWGTFVGNRVREILRLSSSSDWRHVPGKVNPADLPSRGCTAVQLIKSRWWEGPLWLYQEEETWPGYQCPEPDEELVSAEWKRCVSNNVNINHSRPWFMRRTSGYLKILGQMSHVFRFCDKLLMRRVTCTGENLEVVERRLWKIVQAESFQEVGSLKRLQIFKDKDGLLRVQTKILMREDSFNFRCPILLPNKHPLVTELITYEHWKCHGGTQYLVSILREKFWILHTRKAVNAVIGRCCVCQRFTSKRLEVVNAPLPSDRVRDAAVFEIIGVDLAGPLYLKGKEKDKQKAWIVLFTCAVYRAIHLELVTSLDTEHFLQSFRRFIARRGRPRVVYSDNGTNFRGTVNLFGKLDWDSITKKFRLDPIIWKFNPPSASWWGGFFERMIRSVKGLLVRMLGKSSLGYEELNTIMCDVESVINNRPLTCMTEDGKDLIALTPAMFLLGVQEAGVPEIDELEKTGFQKRHRYRQEILRSLQERFRREYLGLLVQRAKDPPKRNIQVGDLVHVENDQKKRLEWVLGRVEELKPEKDNNVRLVKVKTQHGSKFRPLQRLFPLEIESEESSKIKEKVRQTRSGRIIKVPEWLKE